MKKLKWAILGGVILAIALFAAFNFKGDDKPQYFTAKVDRGDIRSVVEATGTINAVTTVQLGPGFRHHLSSLRRLQLAGEKRTGGRPDRSFAPPGHAAAGES